MTGSCGDSNLWFWCHLLEAGWAIKTLSLKYQDLCSDYGLQLLMANMQVQVGCHCSSPHHLKQLPGRFREYALLLFFYIKKQLDIHCILESHSACSGKEETSEKTWVWSFHLMWSMAQRHHTTITKTKQNKKNLTNHQNNLSENWYDIYYHIVI